MKNQVTNKNIVLVLLILTTSLMTMANDLYAPSLAYLPDYFNTTPSQVKLTISLWTLAYGGLLLIYGPLSERFGRRPILVGAMVVFTGCTCYCSFATSIEQLIAARVLQGAAAGAEGVLVLSIIRDCFDERGQVKAFSIYRGVCAVPPIVAPILGAYIFLSFGWQANFLVLAVSAAIVTSLLWKFLEESGKSDTNGFTFRRIALDYARLLWNGRFICFAVTMASAIAFLIVFSSAVPFILVDLLGYTAETFGYFQAGVMVAFIVGSLSANRLAGRLPTARILLLGIGFVALGCALLFAIVLGDGLSLATLAVTMTLIAFGNGPVLVTAPILAMNAAGINTGSSAAMLLTLTSILGSLTAVAESALNDGSARSLSIVMLCAVVCALLAFAGGTRHARQTS